MASPYRSIVALSALLSLATFTSIATVGCADAEQTNADGASQSVVGTFRSFPAAKAADRLTEYFPKALYQGKTPSGDDCTLTISRDDANHLFAASMGVFPANGYESIRFEVHPTLPDGRGAETRVSNWSDNSIALDFDVFFQGDDSTAINAKVSILAPNRTTSSLKISVGERSFECQSLETTASPFR